MTAIQTDSITYPRKKRCKITRSKINMKIPKVNIKTCSSLFNIVHSVNNQQIANRQAD